MNVSINGVCAFKKPYGNIRFGILSVANVVAISGISSNLILFRFFFLYKLREPTLAILSVLDCLLCLCYLTLLGGEAVIYYFRLQFAYDTLFTYVVFGFAISRMVQLGIPAMLILTALQRWCWVSNRKYGCWRILHSVIGRSVIAALILLVVICGRLPMIWAVYVKTYYNCTDRMRTKEVWPRKNWDYYSVYDLCLTVLQALLSFITLLTLNAAIVLKLRSKRLHRQGTLKEMQRRRRNAAPNLAEMVSKVSEGLQKDLHKVAENESNAIKTMAVIVASCLVCNSLQIILTLFERSEDEWVYDNKHREWSSTYLVASDFVSFLFMICSACRLFIYYKFHPHYRKELKALMCCGEDKSNYNGVIVHNFKTSFDGDVVEETLSLCDTPPQRKYGQRFDI